MITPSPTTRLDPGVARGTLARLVPDSATKKGHVVFTVPNTSYELHLVPTAALAQRAGDRLIGIIRASARRIDVVETGGRFVEPVAGRPRRIQGRVVGVDAGALVVDAGVPIHCTPTDPRQTASQFASGALVAFDVLEGATFSPLGSV